MNRADIFKIFDVELNITIFLGALVATFIYFISYMNNVNELITLCLTLAFPAYLLKISRSFIETKNNDTNYTNDTSNMISKNSHSNHTNHQQTEFNNDALKFQALEELPSQIKSYVSNFEIKDIRIIKSILLKGKKSFNNTHDTYYRLEDVEFELVSVLKRFKAMLLQKNETVETMQGYLMQSIKAELEEIHALNMRRQNIPQYNIFNQ